MREKYFIYQGIKYQSGAILKIRPTIGRSNPSPKVFEVATFMFYDTNLAEYFIKVGGTVYLLKETEFFNILISPTDKLNDIYIAQVVQDETLTINKELAIDGMLVAWIWYIFLMGISIILKGVIVYWVIISIIFFRYRDKKLREEGYK